MTFHRIRLEGTGPTPRDHRVFLDDLDISASVTRLQIDTGAGQIDRVKIELLAGIEIPNELKAIVQREVVGAPGTQAELRLELGERTGAPNGRRRIRSAANPDGRMARTAWRLRHRAWAAEGWRGPFPVMKRRQP